ncbi:MAG: hypothetical protein V4772_28190 [Pseudomonadota bacterium]
MFRLILILFGGDALIQRWKFFLAAGLLTMALAAATLIDLFDGAAQIAIWVLGGMLLMQGVAEVVVGATHSRARRGFEMLRGAAMVVFASLVLDFPWDNSIAAGAIFAAAFTSSGLLRIASSLLIRYPGWRLSAFMGGFYLLLALLLATRWPLPDELNVSFCVGLAFMGAGYVLLRGAWRLRRLPAGSRLASIYMYQRKHRKKPARNDLANTAQAMPTPAVSPEPGPDADAMVVHIWTAAGQVASERIRLPLIDRYIFALSNKGGVSTGHVALECGGLYISHHPRVKLQISRDNLLDQVQAVSDNNHSGMWLPTYAGEAEATRPSTLRVRFRVFNPQYLAAFWATYQLDDTYNLTSRNCSVAVTEAIDAAVEGVFAGQPFWRTLLRLVLHPDMWLAGSIRVQAESMAWTPGLALDYASALRRITDSRHDLGLQLSRWWKTRRRGK